MSATQKIKAIDAAQDDLWLVRLRTGKVRAMSLDELDAAFEAGVINALTPLLPPNESVWTRLGVVAGLDDARETTLVGYSETVIMPSSRPRPLARMISVAPVARPTAAPAIAPSRKAPARIAVPRTPQPPVAHRTFVGLALAVLVFSFGISSAARYAFGHTSASETDSVRAEIVASPAQDAKPASALPAPAVAPESDEDGPSVAPRPEHRANVEGTSAVRDAQVRKDGRARRHHVHVRRPTGRTPFINGGDKYDPLNGSL